MPENITEILGKKMTENCAAGDLGFMRRFVKSQMFYQYVEDNCDF